MCARERRCGAGEEEDGEKVQSRLGLLFFPWSSPHPSFGLENATRGQPTPHLTLPSPGAGGAVGVWVAVPTMVAPRRMGPRVAIVA